MQALLYQDEARGLRIGKILYFSALALIGIFAVWWLAQGIPHGPGLVSDSAAYIGGADSLLSGHGYSRLSGGGEYRPITHFPPAFSILIAGISLAGFETQQAAGLAVNALFGMNAVLVGLSLLVATRSRLFSLLGASLFAVNALFIRAHSFTMSEPLFIFLGLLGFLLFSQYYKNRQVAWLAGAGLVMSLASLTRFVGLALIITSLLVIILLAVSLSKGLKEIGVFTSGWLPLVLAWGVRNQIATGFSSNRQVSWHPALWEKYQVGIDRLWSWLLPDRFAAIMHNNPVVFNIVLAGLGFGLATALFIVWKNSKALAEPRMWTGSMLSLWFVHAVYLFVYTAAIVGTITLLDGSTSFENRILAPALTSLLILVTIFWYWLWQSKIMVVRLVLLVVIAVFSARFISDSLLTVTNLKADGQGYSTRVWRESETMQVIREMPVETVIYSNEQTGIYLLTRRGSYAAPSPWDPVLMEPRQGYQEDLSRMKQDIWERKAVLIFFAPGRLTDPDDRAWYADLIDGLPAPQYFADSEMYGWQPLD
jgi:hypothetical protein